MVVSKSDQTVPSVSRKLELQHLKQNKKQKQKQEKNPKKAVFLDWWNSDFKCTKSNEVNLHIKTKAGIFFYRF